MNKKKVIISSAVTMLMAASLMVGGSYAFFTSESKNDITVSSGKVDVVSTINENLKLTSMGVAQTGSFANGGTAKIVNGKDLVLDKMTPGDKVELTVNIKNNSNVKTQYRMRMNCVDGFELFSGLKVKTTGLNQWTRLDPGSPDINNVITVEMPKELGNEYQGLTTKISMVVEAVQGNGHLSDDVMAPQLQKTTGAVDVPVDNTEPVVVKTDNGAAKVTVPAERATGGQPINVTVEPIAKNGNITVDKNDNAIYYDIKVDGLKADNETPVTVSLYIGQGLTGVNVLHDGTPVQNVDYNSKTGYVTFTTTTFSPFAIVSDKNVYVSNQEDLRKAVENEVSIINFSDDIVMSYPKTAGSGLRCDLDVKSDLVLNMNGHSLTREKLTTDTVNGVPCFFNVSGAVEFTIDGNGVMDAFLGDNSSYCVNINNIDADVTIESGSFYGAPTGVQIRQGQLTIEDGTFGLCEGVPAKDYARYAVNCIDRFYKDGTAKVIAKGGNYYNFNPGDTHNEPINPTSYLQQGRVSYPTKEGADTIYHIVSPSTFADVIQGPEVYKLEGDIAMSPKNLLSGLQPVVEVLEPTIIDLNSHNIVLGVNKSIGYKGTPVMFNVFFNKYASAPASLTIRGNGNVDATAINKDGKAGGAYCVNLEDEEISATIEGGNFYGAPTCIQVQEGTLNVKGGRFELTAAAKEESLTNPKVNSNYLINCIDANFTSGVAKINVTGGSFVGFNPADTKGEPENPCSYLPEGYISTEDNGVYTVTTK